VGCAGRVGCRYRRGRAGRRGRTCRRGREGRPGAYRAEGLGPPQRPGHRPDLPQQIRGVRIRHRPARRCAALRACPGLDGVQDRHRGGQCLRPGRGESEAHGGVVGPGAQVLVEVPGQWEQHVADERLAAGQAQFGGGAQQEGHAVAVDPPGQQVQRAQFVVGQPQSPAFVQVLAGVRQDEADRDQDGRQTGHRRGGDGAQPVQVVPGPTGRDSGEFGGVEHQLADVAEAQELQSPAQPGVEAVGAHPVPDQPGGDHGGHGVREQVEQDLLAHERGVGVVRVEVPQPLLGRVPEREQHPQRHDHPGVDGDHPAHRAAGLGGAVGQAVAPGDDQQQTRAAERGQQRVHPGHRDVGHAGDPVGPGDRRRRDEHEHAAGDQQQTTDRAQQRILPQPDDRGQFDRQRGGQHRGGDPEGDGVRAEVEGVRHLASPPLRDSFSEVTRLHVLTSCESCPKH
jgi:hypothetical protein